MSYKVDPQQAILFTQKRILHYKSLCDQLVSMWNNPTEIFIITQRAAGGALHTVNLDTHDTVKMGKDLLQNLLNYNRSRLAAMEHSLTQLLSDPLNSADNE